jgi:hypothetical protein
MYAILKKSSYACWLKDGNGRVLRFSTLAGAEAHIEKIQQSYSFSLVAQEYKGQD